MNTEHQTRGATALSEAVVEAGRRSDRQTRSISERRYQALVEAMPAEGVWVASRSGEMLEDSPRFRRITGQSLDEYRGVGWMDALHPDDRLPTERKWAAALEDQQIYQNEYRVRTTNGAYRSFAAYAVPVIENGEIVEWMGTFTDIHAKRVLSEANERLASTLDQQALLRHITAIAVPAVADWCGVELMDEQGVVIMREASPEKFDVTPRWLDTGALDFVRATGFSLMSLPMHVRGTIVATIHFVWRAEERPFADDDQQLGAELARRAAAALDNARLYAAAENANRARDIFLATLSHEMKTPLTAILGWTRMLRADGPSSDLFDEALEGVEQSAIVQERLIEDILDVSRVITGKLHIEKSPVSLAGVIAGAAEMVMPTARQNGVHLRTHGDSEVTVLGDETRLRQVIWNLLTNAVKFTPAGGFIEVHTGRAGNEARISVRDSGRGIPAEALPHLFEQFHQNSVVDRAQHRGLGLGLAIVHDLVAAHGGRVEAHSAGDGKGSEFIVTLPAVASEKS